MGKVIAISWISLVAALSIPLGIWVTVSPYGSVLGGGLLTLAAGGLVAVTVLSLLEHRGRRPITVTNSQEHRREIRGEVSKPLTVESAGLRPSRTIPRRSGRPSQPVATKNAATGRQSVRR